jgi:FMN phosphatase YigB (HAD superfamily)
MIKTIVFDLDNTLYWMGPFDRPGVTDDDPEYKKFLQTRRLSEENKEILDILKKQYRLFIINYENSNWRFNTKKAVFQLDDYFETVWQGTKNVNKIDIIKVITKQFKADEILVIGDKKHDEIFAGNVLGCHTVQIMIGRHSTAPIEFPNEKPDFQINNLSEIFDVLKKLNSE